MELNDAIRKRRSIRRFRQEPVPETLLKELVDLARLSPCAGNRQPIRYYLATAPQDCAVIFARLRWAGYLPDFEIPQAQRPTAYILLLSQEEACQFEAGAAAMTLMLAAQAQGLDSCCLGMTGPEKLCEELTLDAALHPIAAIALGYGAQRSEIVPFVDSCQYVQTPSGNMLVPKLSQNKCLAAKMQKNTHPRRKA